MRIFLSYRRKDTGLVAGFLYRSLCEHFGRENVFKDVDSIPLGADFRDVVRRELARADVFVALIGPGWVTAGDEAGRPRLHSSNDYVRIEIEEALRLGIPLVPLLLDTPMPAPAQLPASIEPLAYRNAFSIRPDPDLERDVERFTEALTRLKQSRPGAPTPPPNREPALPPPAPARAVHPPAPQPVPPPAPNSLEDIKRRFVDEVKLRAYDTKFIDRNEEREILQIALQLGVMVDSARAALRQVCEANSYLLESAVLGEIRDFIAGVLPADRRFDRGTFEKVVQFGVTKYGGRLNRHLVTRQVIGILEEEKARPRQGFWDKWFDAARKAAGLA